MPNGNVSLRQHGGPSCCKTKARNNLGVAAFELVPGLHSIGSSLGWLRSGCRGCGSRPCHAPRDVATMLGPRSPKSLLAEIALLSIGCWMAGLSLPLMGTWLPWDSDRDEGWRRTSTGWEYANAVPDSLAKNARIPPESLQFETAVPLVASSLVVSRNVHRFHRCALPIAVSFLMATLGPWCLLQLPNRAVKRPVP
jgi:hypothetical protein